MLHRIVVKIGSSSLTSPEGGLNEEATRFLAAELASLVQAGYQPVLVTSGAVAAGFREIGYEQRPKLLHEKQAAAAVGQALLMQAYREAFAEHAVRSAQVLLTRADFNSRKRMGNASMALEELLKQKVIPVINENDTVSVDELKFGDNDTLSALVANLLKADHLLILTDMDGLYTQDPRIDPAAVRISRVEEITEEMLQAAGGAGSSVGTGGMRSKLEAARIATRGGIPVFVGRILHPGELLTAVRGDGHGTYFSTSSSNLPRKKQWLGFLSTPLGRLYVDEGAAEALVHGGRSLLPVGVKQVEGAFHAGDVVEVYGPGESTLGRGIVNYDAEELNTIKGLSSSDVVKQIDVVHRLEVIHRDEWISLK
ncbi:glutamate 5-kinase [Paenibacillus physcomitrellae]|uniref:Glutamate 5-kinase n=1 Tax=Paenibacillus physcomitrellae TaxID=1619311 RepID=A0ABQ1FPK2_9BACL|nr:glutamate 5-kinase [Paenibacillus physcomitrellae]GGA23597.1 glutamate 5-kinase 1 [Paenibacillus physcomitrellae]